MLHERFYIAIKCFELFMKIGQKTFINKLFLEFCRRLCEDTADILRKPAR
jgi:hypothetical protein